MSHMFTQDELETIPCPNCGGSRFTSLATNDRYRMGLTTVGCEGCGLVMTNPRPSPARMEKFYAEEYRRYYTGFKQPSAEYIAKFRRAERARHHVDFLQAAGLLRPGMQVLDIGCAEGSLLKAIRDRVPDARLYGVEPNPDFAAFARTHAKLEGGWRKLEDLLADPDAPQFDLVTIVHVFEHVPNPPAFLASIRQVLAADGAIYIDVPDIAAYRDLDMLHVAHLFHFSRVTLSDAAHRADLAVTVLAQHTPPAHPISIRTVLRAGGADVSPGSGENAADRQSNWGHVRRAMRGAPLFFFRNTPAGRVLLRGPRRLARLLGLG
jgi:2-polyprenyl-3-methyl-5-hydroxy-6-metoxy-1,4-benzoquinol methylase